MAQLDTNNKALAEMSDPHSKASLLDQMSEIVSLREQVAQAELALCPSLTTGHDLGLSVLPSSR